MIVKGKLSKSRMAALTFFADELLTKQMQRHIMITIIFRRKMAHLGLTSVEDYNASYKPREFILDINTKQTEDEIIRTLAHEMVHRKQDELGLIKNPIKDGGTGSPIENQAHAVAGILMREYGRINTQIYQEAHTAYNHKLT